MTMTFKHALLATDGSAQAAKALQMALRPGLAARVSALLVVKDYGVAELAGATFGTGPGPTALRDRMRATGRQLLEQSLAEAAPGGRPVGRLVGIADDPWREIIEAAKREGCDLIVMGSHGRGALAHAVLGSQVAQVLAHAELPVLVVR